MLISYIQFQISNRDDIANSLINKYNIDTRITWPKPIYKQTMYNKGLNAFKKFNCPNTENFCRKVSYSSNVSVYER